MQVSNRSGQIRSGHRPHATNTGHTLPAPLVFHHRCGPSRAKKLDQDAPLSPTGSATQDTSPALKAVWYAAELFGKAVGGGQKAQDAQQVQQMPAMSREELVAALKDDYKENYFISGKGAMAAYAADCEFADPFVSFKGTDRFKQNVSNLGGLMQDVKLDVYEFEEQGPDKVQTEWRFSCVLDLPWKPLLAAAGGTTHLLDLTTGKVVRHYERWDIEPGKVIKQLFRPASKMPSTAAETFMLSLSEGDAAGMWLAATPVLLKASLPVVGVSIVCKLATGEGLPGDALGALEGMSWLLFVATSITECVKLVKGVTGS